MMKDVCENVVINLKGDPKGKGLKLQNLNQDKDISSLS